MKQVGYVKGNIVEKILRDKEGKLVRAQFCIYEDHGRIKARLIEAIYIEEQPLLSGQTLSLSGYKNIKLTWSEVIPKIASLSPFFTKETLYFSGSKPRAPTF
jgi:hypothetical protein